MNVDNEVANRFYLEILLNKCNVVTILANNGKVAVDKCLSNPEIALVLMDKRMPVMDGLEATRIIKSFREEILIFGLSASSMKDDEKKRWKQVVMSTL